MSKDIPDLQNELSLFPGREEELRRVKRWHNWGPMFYRPDLFWHSKKVARLVAHVAPTVEKILPNFDTKRAIAIALVHDDPEILTGDYQAGDKAKMNEEQLAAIDAEEREAIKVLVARYPKTIGGYSYEELQNDVQDLRTPEARVAKFLDVVDGYGEGIHELYAGNTVFVHHIVTEFGLIPLFDDLNVRRRVSMIEKYPEIQKLKDSHLFFEIQAPLQWEPTITGRVPHTPESLQKPVGYPQYDLWKKLILESGDSEEIKNLYTQVEFSYDIPRNQPVS